jgi:hypothetical protein
MQLPRDPGDNQPWSPRWGRELLRYIRSITPQSSNTCRVHRSTGGVTYQPTAKSAKPSRGGGAATERYPFDITLTDAGGGNSTATIWPGTINQLLPSNYLTGVTVSNTGTHFLVLDCTASDGEITAAPLAIESAAPPAITPTQGTPPVAFQVLVGIIIDGVAYKVWGNGSVTASAAESYRVDKGSPVPGSLPYDVFYTWEFSLV